MIGRGQGELRCWAWRAAATTAGRRRQPAHAGGAHARAHVGRLKADAVADAQDGLLAV